MTELQPVDQSGKLTYGVPTLLEYRLLHTDWISATPIL